MVVVLYDTPASRQAHYPLSLTHAIAHLRTGIFTPAQWVEAVLSLKVYALSEPWLGEPIPDSDSYLCLDAGWIFSAGFLQQAVQAPAATAYLSEGNLAAYVSAKKPQYNQFPLFFNATVNDTTGLRLVDHAFRWVQESSRLITEQLAYCTSKTNSFGQASLQEIMPGVWAAAGAVVKPGFFNTEDGPVFIGKNALVMEGVMLRGPVAILEGAVVKMGATLYPGTVVGTYATIGGEVKNSILGDFSNKAHHGYLGDSMVGNWCNLGAGTSNSNVKNNGSMVKAWNEKYRNYSEIGQKAGMLMGSFTRTAIHTAINSGTVVGCCCSLHSSEGATPFISGHIPSFAWGCTGSKYELNKAFEDALTWMAMKKRQADERLFTTFQQIYKETVQV
jgi:UDP-N-acetylglucosamine diphosphorylase/glucosamine-1-phosphate N-acetyltransferase